MPLVFSETLRIFWPLVKFWQSQAQSIKIHVTMQYARFSANLGIFWNSQKTFLAENQKFFQNICPMYFLKNRNYDLLKLKFLPRGFVQIIRIQGLIMPSQ